MPLMWNMNAANCMATCATVQSPIQPTTDEPDEQSPSAKTSGRLAGQDGTPAPSPHCSTFPDAAEQFGFGLLPLHGHRARRDIRKIWITTDAIAAPIPPRRAQITEDSA
jgi:hypothetical protein